MNTQTNFSDLNIFQTLRPINSTEYKNYKNTIEPDDLNKNIKGNKIKVDDLYKYNSIFCKTNKNFFHNNNCFHQRNRSSNLFSDNFNTINYVNKTTNYNNINDLLFSYKKQKRKNDFINSNNNTDKNFNNISFNSSIKSPYNRNKTLQNSNIEKKKETNYSKIFYNFKALKMFYAHLELLLSLYLKRTFKYFIEQIKKYDNKIYENNLHFYNTINNQNQPIINLNNAHCSLYYSININKDLNSNDIYNNTNNTMKNFNISKNIVNNIQKINYILNMENKINLNKKKGNNNKTVYVPKNKANKIKNLKSNKDKYKNNNNFKKYSPIKEMNIDLKKMNLNMNKTNNNNLKNEKNNLKISNSKNNIYKRPKDNNNISKKIIKEIKIKNKEILTPYQFKSKKFFENSHRENNTIKKIYIRKKNSNDNSNEIIKTSLFRNNSDINLIKSFSNLLQNKPKILTFKI